MMHLPQPVRRILSGIVYFLALALLAACGVDSETVDTVDDAVKLLQDVEKDGVWIILQDGLDALEDQDGYSARLQRQSSSDSGPAADDLMITVEVDADGDARYRVEQAGQTAVYTVYAGESAPTGVYTELDGYYTCADAEQQHFADGLPGVFAAYNAHAAAQQTLAIADEDGESTIAGRDATHYTIDTRLDDALAILDQTGNAALRTQIEQSTAAELTGTLDIDVETGALLHFESMLVAEERRISNLFDLTQWGDIAEIASPAADRITVCE